MKYITGEIESIQKGTICVVKIQYSDIEFVGIVTHIQNKGLYMSMLCDKGANGLQIVTFSCKIIQSIQILQESGIGHNTTKYNEIVNLKYKSAVHENIESIRLIDRLSMSTTLEVNSPRPINYRHAYLQNNGYVKINILEVLPDLDKVKLEVITHDDIKSEKVIDIYDIEFIYY